MTDCNSPVWGVISNGRGNVSHEAAFEIKDSLSIYEAARIASGRHPVPRYLDGSDIDAYWGLLAAGSDRRDWRRVRPQRSMAMFHALRDAIEQDRIKPVRLLYLTQPTQSTKGTIDFLFTRVKTIDVARICMENSWQAKLLRPPTEEMERELAGGDEAPDDVETACEKWLAKLPEQPRLTKAKTRKSFNEARRKAKCNPIGINPFNRAWGKSAPSSWHERGRFRRT
jgi:hypothetical protein